LHIAFAFLIFIKIHKNTSPTVLHIGFAFLETWQILGKAWHLCKSIRDLANIDLPRLPRAIENLISRHICKEGIATSKTLFPCKAAARWISDHGSAATGQRRSWTTY